MNDLEARVYNHGEKLVPGVSHAMDELVRHASSYRFFRQVITRHMKLTGRRHVTILDLGCGAGWGSAFLAQIPGARVIGVDICGHSIEYAKTYHKHRNTEFYYADILEFVHCMPKYDFIVSRNMIEHVPDGINVFKQLKWRQMLLVDVPYREPEGANLYHLLHMVDESHFKDYEHPLFLYQDMDGVIYKTPPENIPINIMFVLCQHQPVLTLPCVAPIIPAWQPKHEYEYYDQSLARDGSLSRRFLWRLINKLRVHG